MRYVALTSPISSTPNTYQDIPRHTKTYQDIPRHTKTYQVYAKNIHKVFVNIHSLRKPGMISLWETWRKNVSPDTKQITLLQGYYDAPFVWLCTKREIRHDHPDIDYKQSISHSKPAVGLEWLYLWDSKCFNTWVQHRLGGYIYIWHGKCYMFLFYDGCIVMGVLFDDFVWYVGVEKR